MFKEKIWLSAKESSIIVDYLLVLKNSNYFLEDEIKSIDDLVSKLKICVICLELTDTLCNKISFLIDSEIEAIFFREFCGDSLFFAIEQKIIEFEKHKNVEEKIKNSYLFTRLWQNGSVLNQLFVDE